MLVISALVVAVVTGIVGQVAHIDVAVVVVSVDAILVAAFAAVADQDIAAVAAVAAVADQDVAAGQPLSAEFVSPSR